MMNCKSHKNTSSKFKGVSWIQRDKRWMAYIMQNYKTIYLGYFTSEIEAAKRYNVEAKKLFKEFAKLNRI